MKIFNCFALIILLLTACNSVEQHETKPASSIEGTWKLLSGTLIEKNDTVITDYTKDKSFIKVLNNDHFAFMGHDLNKGKDSAFVMYSSGGGKYELKDSTYTEHLEYFNERQWEGNDFSFTLTISGDTLVQQGIEKIDSIGVNRMNIEKYVRIKN